MAKTVRTAQPVAADAKPGDGAQKCRNCGGDIFYSIRSTGGVSGWLHDDSFLNSCPKQTRSLGPRQQKDARDSATQVWLWGLDLKAAIEDNDVERAQELAKVMTSVMGQITTTLDRARKTD